jgi:hypothetical protein
MFFLDDDPGPKKFPEGPDRPITEKNARPDERDAKTKENNKMILKIELRNYVRKIKTQYYPDNKHGDDPFYTAPVKRVRIAQLCFAVPGKYPLLKNKPAQETGRKY